MSAPAGLLAAALLFWGWQAGLLAVALPCAVLCEAWRWTSRRFELARSDFSRVSDLSAVLFAAMAVYLYFTRPANQAFMTLSAWLPLALLPLMAAQLYCASGRVDVRALFVFMRKQPAEPAFTADIAYPYLILCLLAAGAANHRTALFYPAAALLTAWALWPARPRGSSPAVWAALVASCGLLGYWGQLRLARLQNDVELAAVRLFFGRPRAAVDPEETTTAIGHIGRLKFSDRVALRLSAAPGSAPPRLLRLASYNALRGRRWLAWDAPFSSVAQGNAGWTLGPAGGGPSIVTISQPLGPDSDLLALPAGAALIAGLPAGSLTRSRLGAVMVEDGPGMVSYEVRFSPEASFDGAPDARDLEIPPAERPAVLPIARKLRLRSAPPARAVAALQAFFARNFRYSLYRAGPDPGPDALSEFLLRTRAGHCEYFATAAVLLLRAAGIPARYAAGYSVQEYSRWQRAWIVRDRHAHAWALAYLGGRWRDVDVTPAGWAALEAAGAPWWEPARDALSWAGDGFERWRWSRDSGGPARPRPLWLWAAAAGLMALAWKWLSAKGRRMIAQEAARTPLPVPDSPWYAVERRLAGKGLSRPPWESWTAWLERVAALPGGGGEAAALRPLLDLHLRGRFDPKGLDAADRQALALGVAAWLRQRQG